MKEVILTPEGYEKLKQEIEYLSNDKRREVADRIRTAREFGDIAENAEYDDAKNEQALLEHRIATLEERLRNARVIEKKDIAKDVVSIGSKVKLRDIDAKQTVEYRIVGSAEANPAENKLSNESPGRQGDHRQEEGRDVEVAAPRGLDEVQDPRDQSRLAKPPPRVPVRQSRLRHAAAAGAPAARRLGARDRPSLAPARGSRRRCA